MQSFLILVISWHSCIKNIFTHCLQTVSYSSLRVKDGGLSKITTFTSNILGAQKSIRDTQISIFCTQFSILVPVTMTYATKYKFKPTRCEFVPKKCK